MKALIVTICLFASTLIVKAQDYNIINNRLNEIYKETNTTPGGRITDDKYIRRAYLQIAGRIPTLEEYNSFISNPSKNKRHELVDKLIDSEDFVSHWFNYWADILRTEDRFKINYQIGEPYIDWIKQSIRENKPYDKFVYEILTAEGTIYDNPATGYFWKDRGMPLDNLAGTSEIFFGTNISCAQCHNDPFNDWTQLDYYKFAAFFAQSQDIAGTAEERKKVEDLRKFIVETRAAYEQSGTDASKSDTTDENAIIDISELDKSVLERAIKRGTENAITQILRASKSSIVVEKDKKIKLPHDYKYEDASPNDIVTPGFLFGQKEIKNVENYRKDFAEWATSKDNPFFTRNIVNRLWGAVFGAPIIYPIDSISVTTNIRDKKLIDTLEDIFKSQNYDVKKFLSTLYKTNLFERYNFVGENLDNYSFQGPVLRRLTAEQIWDSILTLTIDDVNYFKSSLSQEYADLMSVDLQTVNIEAALDMVQNYNKIRGEKYNAALKSGSFILVRASDITIPNTTTNILRELGQSERILIQDSTRDGSVTQALLFVNGPLIDIVSHKDSNLMKLFEGKDNKTAVDIAFNAILQRNPTMQEKSSLANASKEDIVWALLNTHEFKFN